MIRGQSLEEAIRAEADALGFVACGFTQRRRGGRGRARSQALARGWASRDDGMDGEPRASSRSPARAVAGREIGDRAGDELCAGDRPAGAWRRIPTLGRISVYAQGGDYHKTVKKALKALARFIVDAGAVGAEGVRRHRAGDGEAARPGGRDRLAGQAHQPRQPRARQLAVPRRDPDQPRAGARRARPITASIAGPARAASTPARRRRSSDRTGSMPGAAFPTSRSSMTARSRTNSASAMGNRIYGCDDCLAVCPWNRFADAAAANRAFLPRAELAAPRLADLLALDDAAFREMFAGSPIKRIGRQADDPQLPDRRGQQRRCVTCRRRSSAHLDDPDPVIAEAARWALDQIGVLAARRCRPPDRCRRPTACGCRRG